jgi:hypothetical protein
MSCRVISTRIGVEAIAWPGNEEPFGIVDG